MSQRTDLSRPKNEMVNTLFGEIAVEIGIVTEDELAASLAHQRDLAAHGRGVPPIGWVLADRGLITPEQVATVLEIQEERAVAQIAVGSGAPPETAETRKVTILEPGEPPPFVIRLDPDATAAPPDETEADPRHG